MDKQTRHGQSILSILSFDGGLPTHLGPGFTAFSADESAAVPAGLQVVGPPSAAVLVQVDDLSQMTKYYYYFPPATSFFWHWRFQALQPPLLFTSRHRSRLFALFPSAASGGI
mmetsp:Transcript_65629/g.137179  ORF Transcript_65629/g.137179 Transcript_65629/m.137179 type:complete len:113 (+) Transcript_65629:134-472(+)